MEKIKFQLEDGTEAEFYVEEMCIRDSANNGPMKGANLRARVNITFEEAVFGCEKELEIVLKDECTTCHGTEMCIRDRVRGFKEGNQFETLLGVTGSGKTFTMANVIQQLNKPTLIPMYC